MKIRTQFVWLVCTVILVPLLMGLQGWIMFSLDRDPNTMPAYQQLPQTGSSLTDSSTWDKVRHILENRPRGSLIYVFNDAQRLIYSQEPATPGITMVDQIRQLKSGTPRDIVLFQPRDTTV